MDSFEWSKIVGAACAALLVIFGTKTLIDLRQQGHETPAVEHAEAAPTDAAKPAAPAEASPAAAPAPAVPKPGGLDVASVIGMIGSASADNGKATFVKCLACHTSEKGAGNKLGPNLWGIVGRPRASIADFTGYSAAMKGKGGNWTLQDLAQFISSPNSLVSGTKMIFPGVKDPAALADILAYIRTQADTPAELPK